MDYNEAYDLQQQGVQLTHEGRFEEAVQVLEKARKVEFQRNAVQLGGIYRDLADAVRRLPGGVGKARVHLLRSARLLPPEISPLEAAFTRHYRGRLERQVGNYPKALAYIQDARSAIKEFLIENPGEPLDVQVQELYLELDYASILALNGKSLDSLKHAFRALQLTGRFGTKDHKVRAFLLIAFAFWPECNWSLAQRAYFGRKSP